MECWRITKYNPLYRNEEGAFLKKNWTSYSDIGRIFGGREFTFDEYVMVENKYIDAVISLMKCIDISHLEVTDLEKYTDTVGLDENASENMVCLFNTIGKNHVVDIDNIPDVCRLILREYMWCKLKYDVYMYVHFGYDFYMYVGSYLKCQDDLDNIIKSGLFVEAFQSPYL
ncbi:MAG: hypothetical protein FH756_17810 [Firmicutes bacterium]|nr:hypothetical protein [Bacillota bacterium]